MLSPCNWQPIVRQETVILIMKKIRITVLQIISIKYSHSWTDNANQTKQHGYEKK